MKKIMFILIMLTLIIIGNNSSVYGLFSVYQNVTSYVLEQISGFSVISPLQNEIYLKRMVLIEVNLTKNGQLQYADEGDELKTLCRKCDYYSRKKPFDDGFHSVKIYGFFETGEATKIINFTVDTQKPKIMKTEPRKGFANGTFYVEFEEANPVSLSINYGNSLIGFRNAEADLDNCFEARRNRQGCYIDVGLLDYDEQEIEYWFNLTDITGKYDKSKAKKLDVDFSKPRINFFDYIVDSRKVTFKINVSDVNFYMINYIDWNDRNPRFNLICSRLKEGECEKRKTFSAGEHNVTIEILDKAGNREVIEDVVFVV